MFRSNKVVPVLLAAMAAATSSAMLFGTDHSSPPEHLKQVWGLDGGREATGYEVQQIATTVPSNVLWPGDRPAITFQIVNKSDRPIRAAARLQTIGYRLRTVPDKGDGMFAYEMLKTGTPGEVPVSVDVPAKGFQNVTVRPLVPARFGGYALILDVPGAGRKLAAGVVRAVPQESRAIQYPTMSLDERDPEFLQRVGIRAIRYGIDYKPTTDPDFPQFLAFHRKKLEELRRHNVTVLSMIGAGGPQPLGQMRSFLNDKGEGPMGYPGDGAWLPSSDPDFKKYCQALCREFGWPKGPITALSLWNEPWEGSSISGWGADMPRYREMYRAMADGVLAARKEGADVLVGGCDSSSNALDKLFPNEDRSFLPVFDFVSLHYQGLNAATSIPFWRERKGPKGRVRLWDTESWAANTDERILPRLASWRAAGYDRLMGVDAANVCDEWDVDVHLPNGKTEQRRAVHAWSPAVAEGAVARYIGDLPFDRLLFGNGLPWAFAFDDPQKPDGGVVVVTGDIGAGARGALRSVGRRSARMTLAVGDFRLMDGDGNVVSPSQGVYAVPLDEAGYYLLPSGKPGSFARLCAAVRKARIDGYDPVEFVARDMTARVSDHPAMRFRLTNVLNRPLRGRLSASLAGVPLPSVAVSLQPGEIREVAVPIRGVKERADNLYPLAASFDAGRDGRVAHRETMRCDVILRRAITVDGNLDDWRGVPPQTIVDAKAQGPSLTEQAWYPFKAFDPSAKKGFAAGYLAYDKDNMYFAAKIADDTPDLGTLRFATRDDDPFYYPATVTKVPRKGEKGEPETLTWPEGVRRYTYRKDPILPAGNGQGVFDNVQIAFNAIPGSDVAAKESYPYPKGTRPGYATYKDTDYEYALNTVAPEYGGGTEIWRMTAPGLPRKQFYPRQPKARLEGPVAEGRLIARREGNTRIVECAIPWREIPWVRRCLDGGKPVKFTYRVNDNDGPSYELATGRSVSGTNGMAFHADWVTHWANEVEFGWGR
ncbi:hypothetical protein BH11ARM2_BH11ARM2_29800 [soil metagenome]